MQFLIFSKEIWLKGDLLRQIIQFYADDIEFPPEIFFLCQHSTVIPI